MKEPIYTLVTGASSGIGKSIAWYCGSLGMNLILVSLPDEGLGMVAHDISEKHNVRAVFLEIDLTKLDSPEMVFKWTQQQNFKINILVNNAGMAGASIFELADLKYIDDRIMLNIRALVILSRLYIPLLKTHDRSYILNVGSLAAFWPIPYKSLYSSTKAFVLYFSKSIRSELKGTGVSISVLCPNGVRTNVAMHARINSHGRMGRMTELSADAVARMGINGMLKEKFVIIPGKINMFVLLVGKIFPTALQQKFLVREFGKEIRATLNS